MKDDALYRFRDSAFTLMSRFSTTEVAIFPMQTMLPRAFPISSDETEFK